MTPPLSDHFNGKTFSNPRAPSGGRFLDLLKWKFSGRSAAWPSAVELASQPPPPAPRGDEIVATWIGHATWLLQTRHGNFLTDPQFSSHAGPRGRFGPLRVHPPGVAFEKLPRIDVVLLSHDHYDHCDVPSLTRLAQTNAPLFVAPLRHRDLLQRAGADASRIIELDWWESHALDAGAQITLTPSQHWSNRLGSPKNHRLWGGFFLTLGLGSAGVPPASSAKAAGGDACATSTKRVWFVGDTGYDADLPRQVRKLSGAPDLALVPIGAYEPRWFMAPMHMNPAEAVATHRDVGARQSVAMHWGTFQLTDEARDEPQQALAAARAMAGVNEDAFRAIQPGESVIA